MRVRAGVLRPVGYLIEAVSVLLLLVLPDRDLGGGVRLFHLLYAGVATGAVLVVVHAALALTTSAAARRRGGRGGGP